MMKTLLAGTAALVLMSSPVFAADGPPVAPHAPAAGAAGEGDRHKDWVPYDQLTLEQARKHAHEHADKLDKMTPEEWSAHKQKVMEKREMRKGGRGGKLREGRQGGGDEHATMPIGGAKE